MPAPTSVLCGSQMAHPLDDQYCCNRRMASWNVGASVGGEAGALAEDSAGAASVEMARHTRTARRAVKPEDVEGDARDVEARLRRAVVGAARLPP